MTDNNISESQRQQIAETINKLDEEYNQREAIKAIGVVYDYFKQFEDNPIDYCFNGSNLVSIKLHMINSLLENMKKSYKKQVKNLHKEGKIVYINDSEFYFK